MLLLILRFVKNNSKVQHPLLSRQVKPINQAQIASQCLVYWCKIQGSFRISLFHINPLLNIQQAIIITKRISVELLKVTSRSKSLDLLRTCKDGHLIRHQMMAFIIRTFLDAQVLVIIHSNQQKWVAVVEFLLLLSMRVLILE